jgi:hypothetical protein
LHLSLQALRAQSLEEDEYIELSKELFDKEYWIQALKLALIIILVPVIG